MQLLAFVLIADRDPCGAVRLHILLQLRGGALACLRLGYVDHHVRDDHGAVAGLLSHSLLLVRGTAEAQVQLQVFVTTRMHEHFGGHKMDTAASSHRLTLSLYWYSTVVSHPPCVNLFRAICSVST